MDGQDDEHGCADTQPTTKTRRTVSTPLECMHAKGPPMPAAAPPGSDTATGKKPASPSPWAYAVLGKGLRGLELRVGCGGAKTWTLRYRVDKEQRRANLGRFPAVSLADARKEALQMIADASRGIDPVERKRRDSASALTFEGLKDKWLASKRDELSELFIRDAEHMLRSNIIGTEDGGKPGRRKKFIRKANGIGAIPANKVTQDDVDRILAVIMKRKRPVQANRCLALISGIYSWARKQRNLGVTITINPTANVQKPGKEKARDNFLLPAQLHTLWHGIAQPDFPATRSVVLAIRLAMVTGQRLGAILSIERRDITLGGTEPEWVAPAAKMKGRRMHVTPLSPLAVELLIEAQRISKHATWVFPNDAGDGPMTSWITARTLEKARPRLGLSGFTLHDLRRTMNTYFSKRQIPGPIRGAVLAHKPSGLTDGTYDAHDFSTEKRAALNLWADELARIVGHEAGEAMPSNVVTLPMRAVAG